MKSSSALFKWPKNWRAPRPPPTTIVFQKSTDQNSEIAILFNVVEKPYNDVFGDHVLPTVSVGGVTSYKRWPVLTYSNGYSGVYRRFQGDFLVEGGVEKRGMCWGNFPTRNSSWGKKISTKEALDFLALLKKKQWKNNYEKNLQLEVRSSIKT